MATLFWCLGLINFVLFFTKEKTWNQKLRLIFETYGEGMLESSAKKNKTAYVHFFIFTFVVIMFKVMVYGLFLNPEHELLKSSLSFLGSVMLIGILGFKNTEDVFLDVKRTYKPILITLSVILMITNIVGYMIESPILIMVESNLKIILFYIGALCIIFALIVLIPNWIVNLFVEFYQSLLKYCLSKPDALSWFLVSLICLGFIINTLTNFFNQVFRSV